MIYWDTSCVLKLYAAETDSSKWQALALSAEDDLAASALLETEMAFALEQKELRGELCKGGAKALFCAFRRDVRARRFVLYPVGEDVLSTAADLAKRCYHAAPPVMLRTLDGLHMATAHLAKCRSLATTDQRMREAASLLKIPLIAAES